MLKVSGGLQQMLASGQLKFYTFKIKSEKIIAFLATRLLRIDTFYFPIT